MTVKRYRKKPVEVLAVQWTGTNEAELTKFVGRYFGVLDPEDRENSDDPDWTAQVLDDLRSRWLGLRTGDWVVQGPRGNFHPVPEDVFAETYEEVS